MKTLAIDNSEQLFDQRKKKCLERGEFIFETGQTEIWLNSPVRALGFRTPASLLESKDGYRLVLNTLGQIEAGIIS
jgi:uncharacterized protein (DUF2384 family)